jgi:hypothetical protein
MSIEDVILEIVWPIYMDDDVHQTPAVEPKKMPNRESQACKAHSAFGYNLDGRPGTDCWR